MSKKGICGIEVEKLKLKGILHSISNTTSTAIKIGISDTMPEQ